MNTYFSQLESLSKEEKLTKIQSDIDHIVDVYEAIWDISAEDDMTINFLQELKEKITNDDLTLFP
jgi:hypothetical protein